MGLHCDVRLGAIRECAKTEPSDGDARGSCRSADRFGASPVASALGSQDRRDPAPDSHHFTIAAPTTRLKPDILVIHFTLVVNQAILGLAPLAAKIGAIERGLSKASGGVH